MLKLLPEMTTVDPTFPRLGEKEEMMGFCADGSLLKRQTNKSIQRIKG